MRTSLAAESETDGSLAYGTESGRRSSVGTVMATESEYTGTGSYVTGSDVSGSNIRSTSYGSTVRSTPGAGTVISEDGTVDGEVEEHEAERPAEEQTADEGEPEATLGVEQDTEAKAVAEEHGQLVPVGTEAADTKQMIVYPAPSDSGLGSDLPTAAMSGSEMDYLGGLLRRKLLEPLVARVGGCAGLPVGYRSHYCLVNHSVRVVVKLW